MAGKNSKTANNILLDIVIGPCALLGSETITKLVACYLNNLSRFQNKYS